MRAMVVLAKNEGGEPLSLAQISRVEHISPSYLEHILAKLKADDLIKSVKGANGGYVLSRLPKRISVFEIVEALEGPLAFFYCMGDDQKKVVCVKEDCLTKRVWREVQNGIIKSLRKFSLADLI